MKPESSMLRSVRLFAPAIIGIGFWLATSTASAQVVVTDLTTTYSQNFDSLSNTGTTNTWTDNSTLPGWYATKAVTPPVTVYRADNGTSNAGALYSFGATGSTERALGTISSGTPGALAWGMVLQNTGSTSFTVAVSFTGEQWRDGGAATPNAQTTTFTYLTSSTNITNFDASGVNASGFTTYNPLSLVTPTFTNTTTGAAIDGNNPANETTPSGTIPVTLDPGMFMALRWFDPNDIGNDHGMGVDNLNITFTAAAVPEPSSLALLGGVLAVGFCRRVRRKA
jgi:hypothetical protein